MSAVEHIRQEYVKNHYEGYNYKEDKLKIGVKEPEYSPADSPGWPCYNATLLSCGSAGR